MRKDQHCVELPQDGILKAVNADNVSVEFCHRLKEQLRDVLIFRCVSIDSRQRVTLQHTATTDITDISNKTVRLQLLL